MLSNSPPLFPSLNFVPASADMFCTGGGFMGKAKLTGIIIGAVAVIVTWGHASWGGETTVYATSGYFTWNEKIAGADFINERGMLSGLGLARRDTVLDAIALEELVEIWGGNLDYDGHDVTNSRPLHSDTTYLGTREEIAVGERWPLTGTVAAGPLFGIGHRFWIRTRSSEDWNLVYGTVGGTATYAAGQWQLLAKGGISLPLYTRSHVSLESAGYEDVVTRPRGEPAPFAEVSARRGAWSLGVRYEEMRFAESVRVTTRTIGQPGNGIAVIDSHAFQPASTAKLIGMKLEYHF